jgi:phenylacetate-coenzyme A ligase PaaK-like adenylate-forming protein
VPIGSTGSRLLVTVLFSRSLPLIRYELTDRVALSSDRCACRRPFAVLERIEGRTADVLTLPSAAGASLELHPNIITDVLDRLPLRGVELGVEGGALRVRLEADEGSIDPSSVRRDVAAALAARGAAPRSVDVELVAHLPRAASGKAAVLRRETQIPTMTAV